MKVLVSVACNGAHSFFPPSAEGSFPIDLAPPNWRGFCWTPETAKPLLGIAVQTTNAPSQATLSLGYCVVSGFLERVKVALNFHFYFVVTDRVFFFQLFKKCSGPGCNRIEFIANQIIGWLY